MRGSRRTSCLCLANQKILASYISPKSSSRWLSCDGPANTKLVPEAAVAHLRKERVLRLFQSDDDGMAVVVDRLHLRQLLVVLEHERLDVVDFGGLRG